MNNITIVKIINPERYNLPNQSYGILVQSMQETAVVNFSSNKDGLCININHSDYAFVSPSYYSVIDNEIVVRANGGYVYTGLKIWE